MSRPWMKFYPSDWRADPALRMCSLGARGLWAEMMCIMHEALPYGFLLINGKPVSDKQLASLAGSSLRETAKYLAELEQCAVFSRDDAGTVFSRRMKRDQEKAERDKANGGKGGNPRVKEGVNPQVNGGDKAQIPETRSQKESDEEEASSKSVLREASPQLALVDSSEGLSGKYAFDGRVIHLTQKDFSNWVKAFPALDIRGELTARDAWLASDRATEADRKNWFVSTSKYLANRNMEARAKTPARSGAVHRGIEGII